MTKLCLGFTIRRELAPTRVLTILAASWRGRVEILLSWTLSVVDTSTTWVVIRSDLMRLVLSGLLSFL